ncbi:protein-cysteine N-palmitoyltransferase HHAT isoform X8 [Choloepus didactylus]|uniref:protein-cysteine N-palmitoyltransferase HHAT isoform X8 n=1 Tax=Choloepus didactylus TaxID=27675 RepID=UPI00189E63D6|nr:protein-cysteine N-palmitoyltransferase HHAT isoform X8 [Choloepus didactylus]
MKLNLSEAQTLDSHDLWNVGLLVCAGGSRRGHGFPSHRHLLLRGPVPVAVTVVALFSPSPLHTEAARCGGSQEKVVPDRKRVLLAAVHADRSLLVLHQLQPRVLLAAAACRVCTLLLSLDVGLRLLLPSLPQRAHPRVPGVRQADAAAGALLLEGQPPRPRPGAGPPPVLVVAGRADGPPDVHARHLQQHPTPGGRLFLGLRRPGLGPSALFLCEVLGALRHPSSAHAPGWTKTATPPSLCEHHVQFHGDVEVCVHSSGRVPAWPAGDTVLHSNDVCICELLAWRAQLPLVLGSSQLAGSHCGKWSPEAGGDPVCPGHLGPISLPTSSPSFPRCLCILLHLNAHPVQPGVSRWKSSWENLLEQDLHTGLAVGHPLCPGILVLLLPRGHRLGPDVCHGLMPLGPRPTLTAASMANGASPDLEPQDNLQGTCA